MIGSPDVQLPEKGLEGPTGFFTWRKSRPRESPEPVTGLSTLLVQLCQEAMVVSKEIGNWGANGNVDGNQPLLLGAYTVNVSRPQCH